ncbi:cytochrome P450 6A1 [Microdochium bolleyi]|uniref:Cytochrome P450 6A1 n=1 Tax=Microdochium bolleyi TaxID=196109 RepID=A0A136JH17_9PEZI|nr:cytochrome P450 6A1 [Microdochium bolleyi]
MTILSKLVLDAGEVPASVWLLLATASAATLVKLLWRPSIPKNAPKWWRENDWPILGALRFYSARPDFMLNAARHTPGGNFSFYIGKKHLVALTGEEGRKTYFDNKDLGFSEGFAELLTGQPAAPAQMERFSQWFAKSLLAMLKKDQFVRNLDALTGDTRSMFESIGAIEPCAANPEWRVMDPFHHLYRTVYKLTMRTVGAEDIAEDPKLLEETLEHFETFESLSSLTRIIFPWMPTYNYVRRMYKGARLAMVFKTIIAKRKETGKKRHDALQYLIDQGGDLQDVIAFVIAALFAGLLNSGINAGWIPVFLTQNEEWMARVRAEVDGVVAKRRKTPQQSAADVLDTLSIEDWEAEFPMADLCLRESIRFALPGASFRKNLSGRDIEIGGSGGQVIPNGAFATYLLEDVHFNPDVYSDMNTFDPSRYLEDRAEDKKAAHAYLGWGSGRHPCLGMRFAKLENALILAYFVAMYEFELAADAQGNPATKAPPLPNRLENAAQKPAETQWLRFKPRTDAAAVGQVSAAAA